MAVLAFPLCDELLSFQASCASTSRSIHLGCLRSCGVIQVFLAGPNVGGGGCTDLSRCAHAKLVLFSPPYPKQPRASIYFLILYSAPHEPTSCATNAAMNVLSSRPASVALPAGSACLPASRETIKRKRSLYSCMCTFLLLSLLSFPPPSTSSSFSSSSPWLHPFLSFLGSFGSSAIPVCPPAASPTPEGWRRRRRRGW